MALKRYADRARAESFGTIAAEYDRYRPTHPEALIDDLAALRPTRVLDIACGTGKVAVSLVARGLDVLGVEIDERMARVARGHGIPVEVSAFETWDDVGRRFDLITCGAAWHWIDPARGVPKAATLLRPGGRIARFWSYHRLDASALAVLDEVYAEHAPEAHTHGRGRVRSARENDETDPFAASDAFTAVETRTYRWEHTLSTDEWVGMIATFSDHQRLEPSRLSGLQAALRVAIDERLDGVIQAPGETYVALAQRAG